MILTVLACHYNRWGHSAGQDMVGTARQQLGTSLCQNRRGRSPGSEATWMSHESIAFQESKLMTSCHRISCNVWIYCTHNLYKLIYVYYAMHWCLFVHVICTQTTCLCSIIPSLWLSPICVITAGITKLFLNYWLLDEQYPFPDKAWWSSVHRSRSRPTVWPFWTQIPEPSHAKQSCEVRTKEHGGLCEKFPRQQNTGNGLRGVYAKCLCTIFCIFVRICQSQRLW